MSLYENEISFCLKEIPFYEKEMPFCLKKMSFYNKEIPFVFKSVAFPPGSFQFHRLFQREGFSIKPVMQGVFGLFPLFPIPHNSQKKALMNHWAARGGR